MAANAPLARMEQVSKMRRSRNLSTTNKMKYCNCPNQNGKRIASDCEDCGGVVRVDNPKSNSALEFLAQELEMPAEHIREAARAMKLERHKQDDRCCCPDCGKTHLPSYHDQEPCDECCDRLIADSESQREADKTADETCGRSAYNAIGEARADSATSPKPPTQ